MDSSRTAAFPLPPLILHPFSAPEDTQILVDSTRATLALQKQEQPMNPVQANELDCTLLRGRFAELKMLFYIGKDVLRWMDQCAESVAVSAQFADLRVRPETFGLFLVQHIPAHVRVKLETWGVLDFCALFRRSIAMHSVFGALPAPAGLNADFLRRYHRHLDLWYEHRMRDGVYYRAQPSDFTFDLFASGEYTLMLEQSWNSPTAN